MPTVLELAEDELAQYVKEAQQHLSWKPLTGFEQDVDQALLDRIAKSANYLKSHFGASSLSERSICPWKCPTLAHYLARIRFQRPALT